MLWRVAKLKKQAHYFSFNFITRGELETNWETDVDFFEKFINRKFCFQFFGAKLSTWLDFCINFFIDFKELVILLKNVSNHTANVLTIETIDFNHVPNPTRMWAKTIESVVIILAYLDFKIQILFLLISENHGLLPIKNVKDCVLHSQ